MDWRALLQNPWVQLCLLVAVLSAGALGYDVATGRFPVPAPPKPVPGPVPGPVVSPSPAFTPFFKATPIPTVAKLKSKTKGQWIVDASGAKDADGRDLRQVAGNLTDGDTVTVRAGTYDGGFAVTRSARFIGQGIVTIHGANQDTIAVSGPHVTFEHIRIAYDATGNQFNAIHVQQSSHAELADCWITSRGEFAIKAMDNSSLEARDSKFQTFGTGTGINYQNRAQGKLDRCVISDNQWGFEASDAANVELSNCVFERNGLPTGTGHVLQALGTDVQVKATTCTFTNNTSTIFASGGATLDLEGCTLRGNGVAGIAGNTNDGMIKVYGGKLFLNNGTLDSNKQGIVAMNGGVAKVSRTKIIKTGILIPSQNGDLWYYSQAFYASDPNSALIIADTTIADSVLGGIMVLGGAALDLQNVTVSGSGGTGVYVGYSNTAASRAELTGTKILNNHSDGILVCAGSSITAQGCDFSGNTSVGLEVGDANSQGRISDTFVRENSESGLMTHDGAILMVTHCTLEKNTRGAQAGVDRKPDSRASLELENCAVQANTNFGLGACSLSTVIFRHGILGNNGQNVYTEGNGTVRQLR